jgi:hypothetical protein
MAEGKIYVAKTDALVQVGGNYVPLKAGVTRVREGHELLKGRMDLFRELDVHYDLEDARSAPEQEKPVPVAEERAQEPEKAEGKPAGLTSDDAPTAPPRRGRRVTKTD